MINHGRFVGEYFYAVKEAPYDQDYEGGIIFQSWDVYGDLVLVSIQVKPAHNGEIPVVFLNFVSLDIIQRIGEELYWLLTNFHLII